jgi:hypothetical protein
MKTSYNIRFFLILVLLSGMFVNGGAQTTQISYFMENTGTRSLLNPALRPAQGYVGIPLINNIFVNENTNTLVLDNLTFHKNGEFLSFLNEDVSVDEFMKNISDNNYLSADFNISLLSAGWYSGKSFWSLNIGLRGYGDFNLPKDYFKLAKEGFGVEKVKIFDLSNLSASSTVFAEAGLGYSRTFLKKNSLTIGIRAKYLVGIGNGDVKLDHLTLQTGEDDWIVESNAKMRYSLPGIYARYEEDDGYYTPDIEDDFDVSPAGTGFGFDLGFEFDFSKQNFGNLLDRFKLSAAITDFGYVKWKEVNSIALYAKGRANINPDNLFFSVDGDGEGNNGLRDHFGTVTDDLETAVKPQLDPDNSGTYTTRLRSKLNVGAECDLLKDKLSLGLLSSTTFGQYYNVSELTFSANYTPSQWLAVSGSHSFVHGAFQTYGLALNIAPSQGLNLFIASDYLVPRVTPDLYIPINAKGLNLQVGFTVPIGSKRP